MVKLRSGTITDGYNLRDLGPWDPEGMGLWSAVDPFNTLLMLWWQEAGLYPGQYLDANAQPIYFAGTDPRHRGFPPLEDENELGNPREQWERDDELIVHGSVD